MVRSKRVSSSTSSSLSSPSTLSSPLPLSLPSSSNLISPSSSSSSSSSFSASSSFSSPLSRPPPSSGSPLPITSGIPLSSPSDQISSFPALTTVSRASQSSITPFSCGLSQVELNQVNSTQSNKIVGSTQQVYKMAINRFFDWLRSRPSTDAQGNAYPPYFDSSGSVIIENITLPLMKLYYNHRLTLVKSKTITTDRSALLHLLHSHNRSLTAEQEADLHDFFRGLANTDGRQKTIGIGNGNVAEGKEDLPFPVYGRLSEACLFSLTDNDSLWCHAYMVWLWNLMCRTTNVSSLLICNLGVAEDCITAAFVTTKTSTAVENSKGCIHIYANPIKPHMCPFLALGLHWAMFSIGSGDNSFVSVFEAKNDGARFSDGLKKLLRLPQIKSFMEQEYGLEPDQFGTHSYRKGSSTYTSSGTTAAPSLSSICARAGWKFSDVKSRYMRLEAAGDQYLGRVVCGLDVMTDEFACVPPHFMDGADESLVEDGITLLFASVLRDVKYLRRTSSTQTEEVERPGGAAMIPKLKAVMRLLLASVVYHSQYLLEKLPSNSPVRMISLFRNTELLTRLKSMVSLEADERMQPRGIPPHVALMQDMRDVKKQLHDVVAGVSNLKSAIASLPEQVSVSVNQSIDSFCEAQGTITPQALQRSLTSQVVGLFQGLEKNVSDQLKTFQQILQDSRGPAPNSSSSSSTESAVQPPNPMFNGLFLWGGMLRRVSETFKYPSSKLEHCWECWWLGRSENPSQVLPPFRTFEANDMPKSERRMRCEWDLVFSYLTKELEKKGWNLKERPIDSLETSRESFALLNDIVWKIAAVGMASGQAGSRYLEIKVATCASKVRVMLGAEFETDELNEEGRKKRKKFIF